MRSGLIIDIGGATDKPVDGGMTYAARLARAYPDSKVVVIDPSSNDMPTYGLANLMHLREPLDPLISEGDEWKRNPLPYEDDSVDVANINFAFGEMETSLNQLPAAEVESLLIRLGIYNDKVIQILWRLSQEFNDLEMDKDEVRFGFTHEILKHYLFLQEIIRVVRPDGIIRIGDCFMNAKFIQLLAEELFEDDLGFVSFDEMPEQDYTYYARCLAEVSVKNPNGYVNPYVLKLQVKKE